MLALDILLSPVIFFSVPNFQHSRKAGFKSLHNILMTEGSLTTRTSVSNNKYKRLPLKVT